MLLLGIAHKCSLHSLTRICLNSQFLILNSQFEKMIYNNQTQSVTLTVEELAEALRTALGELRVYVLESDITEAQQAVRTVVQQATIEQ